jgi:D-cysteine desulfhydrase
MRFDARPRCTLAQLPTPIEELPRLTHELGGPRLLVKRDDQTGLALGGSKVRKLEFLVGDALAKGADTVVTAGLAQSNHCRQTAAAAAKAGMACELVLAGKRPEIPNCNLLLDLLCGANLHWTVHERRSERMNEIAESLRTAGRTPYVIPVGGSNGLGALGCAHAMVELQTQLSEPGRRIDYIVFATSSGGTQAGMALGARLSGFPGVVLGISIDRKASKGHSYLTELAAIANEGARILGVGEEFSEDDFVVNDDYLGGGYGVIGDLERRAIGLAAQTEGLILDPVYTGRAMGGLIDLIERDFFSRTDAVLFWHTGGTPALFAYAEELALIRNP